jgi:plastocyanin
VTTPGQGAGATDDRSVVEIPRWVLAVVGVVVAAAVVLLVTVLTGSDGDEPAPAGPRTVTFVVPPGTGARIDAGEAVDVFPGFIELKVGDSIRIENQDDRTHIVGPIAVRAGETVTHTFDRPGGYRGDCTLHTSGSTEILVL